mmetsp:Transcript_12128/g.28774  ORF Transcript_12128/g.28774 Transcript_12128/m.28774 type:complete len:791 (-) Transcript_12128:49-2421(-)
MTSVFHTINNRPVEQRSPPSQIFHAVVEKNYDGLANIFAENARNSVLSYLSMSSRWARHQDSMRKSEEKIDEFLHDASHSRSWQGSKSATLDSKQYDGVSYSYSVLQNLSVFISENTTESEAARNSDCQTTPLSTPDESLNHGSKSVHRFIWDSCSTLADSPPPSNFCIYDRSGATTPPQGRENDPPIFDGSVANATPAPHGGVGATSGTGTILHLVCAMDRPLMLAFLLIMGADGRANHTAFRRLMIHEAACNGSINCLTLLLEMGHRYSKEMEDNATSTSCYKSNVPFLPDAMERSSPTSSSPRLSARPTPQISVNLRDIGRANQRARNDDHDDIRVSNCIPFLRKFKSVANLVREGDLTELQAARSLLAHTHILERTRNALISSCTFRNDKLYAIHSFLRPFGCADGHGNTPLHWASFKNERECVALLLRYNADPNARAHPSGWTPLHDAAYSNSSACIELLSENGAQIDAKANSGATPLCFAAQEDASEAARLLLDRGADLASRCAGPPAENDGQQYNFQLANHPHSRFSGYTPLHYCAHYNAQRASHVLLNHPSAKVAMEVPDLSGRLPIHVAVARGSSDVLRALLHSGARVDTPPSRSPTNMARQNTANFSILSTASTRRPPVPEEPGSPNRFMSSSTSSSPVTSPVLRSMIPSQPISSSKPWNCLSQQAIDECKELILKSEQSWSPDHHLLFTPQDRKAVMELLRVGKRLEQNGTGIFLDLWPTILGFCGRGWFEKKESEIPCIEDACADDKESHSFTSESNETVCLTIHEQNDYLALPRLDN